VMLAAMWKWQELPEGGGTLNFLILTATPNDLMKPIHNRMPVILDSTDFDEWMDSQAPDPTKLRRLLKPVPDDWLVADCASPLVNNVKNDGPELLPSLIS
jgi:putative SOS response-associated peptidase YedK